MVLLQRGGHVFRQSVGEQMSLEELQQFAMGKNLGGGYLIANNAVAHIGDVSNVSPIFFGNDFPDAPPGMTSEMEPTHSLLFYEVWSVVEESMEESFREVKSS